MKKSYKLALAILFALTSLILFFLIPPQSIFLVFGFIISLSLAAYILAGLFFHTLYQNLILLFCVSFLTMTYLIGFQLLNTILLICFIIGLGLLFKK
jgi:hypothetical protein